VLEQQKKQGQLVQGQKVTEELHKKDGIIEDYKKMLADEKAKI
jgi:hypothetical protein